MDLTQEKIDQWLKKNHKGYNIVELDIESGERFLMHLRCKLGKRKPDHFLKWWVEKFSLFTMTNWIVHKSYPSIQRMIFRKTYICHHSNFNKAPKSECQKINKRNKDCKAKIDFKVKKTTRSTCRNDPLLSEGLNCVIRVNFRHTHSVRSLESYRLLRCNQKTKRKFLEYCSLGMVPLVAKAYNEIQIRAAHYDERERETQLANGIINPNMRSIDRIYYTWKNENRNFIFDSFEKLLKDKASIEANGSYIKIIANLKIIVVLTELTKKIFLRFSENVFIDSSGYAGREFDYMTSIFAPTKIGALPIGYILHSGKTKEEYQMGFDIFAQALKEFCGKEFKPKVIITNDGELTEELERFFPNSSVELCAYTNCSQFWTMLCERSDCISQEDCKRMMTNYHHIISSQSRSECENMLKEMKEDPVVISDPDISEIINRLWTTKEEWLPKSSIKEMNKLTSTHMRIYKDAVCPHFRKFNAYTLVKLFTGPINDIYRMYLMQYALKGTAVTPIFNLLYDTGDFNILPIAQSEYMVQSLKDLDHVHTVYTDIIYCTCKSGAGGHYCNHLCAVEKEFPFHQTPKIDEHDRQFFNCPEMDPAMRKAIEKADESEEDSDHDNTDNFKLHEIQFDHNDPDTTDDHEVTCFNNEEIAETNMTDDEISDDIKMEVPIELIPVVNNCKVKGRKTGCIKEVYEKSNNQSKPLKRAIDSFKETCSGSQGEFEPGSVEVVPSTSKVRSVEATSSLDEEADIISKGWGLIYKRLKPRQQIYAKKAIDDILFEASLGTLGRNSIIINQNSQDVVEIDPFEVKEENFD